MDKKYPSRVELRRSNRKRFYKKWWFWLIAVIVICLLVFAGLFVTTGNNKNSKSSNTSSKETSTQKVVKKDNAREKSSGITLKQYNGLYLSEDGGLSSETLKSIFGSPSSTSNNTIQGIKTDVDTWKEVADSDQGATVVVNYSNNHAISKAITKLRVSRSKKISLHNYNKIQNGVSESDIISELGKPNGYSEVVFSGTSTKKLDYTSGINGSSGASVVITLTNGVVSDKSQTGLK